jgi:hypothetical protein
MRVFKGALLAFVAITGAAAQTSDALLSDKRLTVHTLLREDIFAGFMSDNMKRFAQAEQNIEILLKERPEQRANLLAWKASALTYRAVVAHESKKADESEHLLTQARELFAEASKLSTGNDGVAPITGGALAIFADRLPEARRASAWSQAYDSYSLLWKQQGAGIAKMPVHFKGEVLAGLTQSAQRTGRTEEVALYLDQMLEVLANTPYEAMAKKWKEDPASAATTNLTCKNCHNPGRLSARVAALNKAQ